MDQAALGRERLQRGTRQAERLRRAAHHQAVAVFQSPDTAARAGIHEQQAALLQLLRTAHRVLEIRVPPVDDQVAARQLGRERDDQLFGDPARRHHRPDNAGRLERRDELIERRRRGCSVRRQLGRLARIGIVGENLVPPAQQPLRHVPAHPA